ncbi:MAG: Kae1-like domain-containing protein, partial [Candidatus Thorarchaeota archaeon]
ESMEFLQDALNHMINLLDVTDIQGIACDLHPEFLSTESAENISSKRNVPLHRIQHHHAHLVSLLVDARFLSDTRIICITADGFGYGNNSKAWGGEILAGDMNQFERKGGLSSSFHIGGDLAAKFAVRPLIGILGNIMTSNEIVELVGEARVSSETVVTEDIVSLLLEAQKRRVNVIESTSAGRFLDSAAAVLGICSENSYDGECPMKLEAAARETSLCIEPEFLSSDYGMLLDVRHSIASLFELKRKGYSIVDLAYAIQWHLGSSLADIACHVADSEKTEYIGFSGGVALNHIITKAVVTRIEDRGFKPLLHRNIPPGDGGIAAGQVAATAAQIIG